VLSTSVTPHRAFLQADTDEQKLFVMIKMLPTRAAANHRPPLEIALVVDTSGSMSRPLDGSAVVPSEPSSGTAQTQTPASPTVPTKLHRAMDAARGLVDSEYLRPDDVVALIHFDTESRVLANGGVGRARDALLEGIESLARRRGGTFIARGLRNAEQVFSERPGTARMILLLTDGQTADEPGCVAAARRVAARGVPIVAVGLGEAYNEDLLAELSGLSFGRPYHLPDAAALGEILEREIRATARQVVADVRVKVDTADGVRVVSAERVYPAFVPLEVGAEEVAIGGIEAGDHTIALIELELGAHPRERARVAQLGVTYRDWTGQTRGEIGPLEVVVEFTGDNALASRVDPEVMGYVQQRNAGVLIARASREVSGNPQGAMRTLQVARTMTERAGNHGMARALGQAERELRATGTLSAGTVKGVKVGWRTHTVKVTGQSGTAADSGLSEDEIRRLSGA
jgi:Ca-activated chloride channel family protein